MEVVNTHVDIEAPVHTVHTMSVIVAQPSGALGLFHTTLASWHKRHCLLRPCLLSIANVSRKNLPDTNPAKNKVSTDSGPECYRTAI